MCKKMNLIFETNLLTGNPNIFIATALRIKTGIINATFIAPHIKNLSEESLGLKTLLEKL